MNIPALPPEPSLPAFKVGDRVRLKSHPAEGVLCIDPSPHNLSPWNCTGSCRRDGCVEWLPSFSDGPALSVEMIYRAALHARLLVDSVPLDDESARILNKLSWELYG